MYLRDSGPTSDFTVSARNNMSCILCISRAANVILQNVNEFECFAIVGYHYLEIYSDYMPTHVPAKFAVDL